MKNTLVYLLTALASIVAGGLHATVAASQHMTILPEGVFFIAVGVAQILWGLWFLIKRDDATYYTGIGLHGALVVVWILTRIVQAPFQSGVESFGMIDSFIAACQILALVGLGRWRNQTSTGETKLHHVVLHIKGWSLAKGIVLYVLVMASVPLFPQYQGISHHHGKSHSHGHGHSDRNQPTIDAPNTEEVDMLMPVLSGDMPEGMTGDVEELIVEIEDTDTIEDDHPHSEGVEDDHPHD